MKYIAYSKSRIQKELFYKFDFLMLLLSSLILFTVEYSLWKAVYNGQQELAQVTFYQMFLYIVMGHILRKFLGEGVDELIGDAYRSGSIVIDRIKPVNLFLKYLFEDLGRGLIQIIAVAVPLISFLIMKSDNLSLSVAQLLSFVILSILAYVLYFLLNFLLGLISFWTQSIIGIYMLKMACMGLLAGMYVPLEFYPIWLRIICDLLPFKAIYYIPISAIIKEFSGKDFILSLRFQLFWIAILGVIGYLIQKKAFKKMVVQGG